MKKNHPFLKIAGVKSIDEFYQKFPSEEAFLKKHGKALKKAQVGTSIDAATTKPVKPINFGDIYAQAEATNMGISLEEKKRQEALAAQKASSQGGGDSGMAGLVGTAMKAFGGSNGDIIGNVAGMFQRGGYLPMAQDGGFLKSLPIQGLSDSAKALPTLTSPTANTDTFKAASLKDTGNALLGQAGSIIGNIQAIGEMQHQQDQQKQFAQISDVTAQAAESQDVDAKRQKRYVRPEDMAFQPGQMGSPYGQGTNYLQARNGAEIQNTYAPSNLYMDLGYEPLNDSNVKQFQFGGIASGIGSWVTGGGFQDSPEGQIGSVAGKTIGALIPIPGASQVLEGVGGLVGGIFGGSRQKETNNYAEQGKQNTIRAAGANFGNVARSQFSGSLEDGGWVSNDWMPQTIAKFGEYDVKDLLKPPHDADMLRSGGHLKEYTPPSARAMYTGRRMDDGGVMHSTNMMFDTDRFPRAEYGTQMAMGGDLQVHRGKAETMSYNPYLPDGGETIMFRGPSHDNGGMPVTFGQNGVEVEGGEPAVKLQDGGSPDGNLVVFGDMYMPGNKQKFKHYAADLSKTEAKQNKIVDKSTNLVNNLEVNNEFDKLSLQAANANIIGANMKLRDIAAKKTEAAALQNAILDTASEQGLVAADLAKGKIVKDKEAMKKAKFGAKMETAQTGTSVDPNDDWIKKILNYEITKGSATGQGLSNFGYNDWDKFGHKNAPRSMDEAVEYFKQDYLPKVDYLPLGLRGRAGDWAFNSGKDPRIPLLMAARKIKSNAFGLAGPRVELAQDPKTLDELWNKNSAEITKKQNDPAFLKEFDKARKVMYQNIKRLPDGSINPAYSATWKGRTNMFNEDDIPVPASATAPIVPMGTNAPSSARFQRDGIAPANMNYPQSPIDARAMFAPDAYSPIDMDNNVLNIPHTPYDATITAQRDVLPVFNEDTAAAALKGKKKGKGFNWKDASLFAQSIMPFVRPTDQEPLDPAQISAEMSALASNQLEPVQAQLYTPQLSSPFDISLQDQLNASQADFNAMQKQLGNNPELLAGLAAQKRLADAQILGNQTRANQAERARVYEANRQTLNEAQRANLGILDQQFNRQSIAKSKTKQEAQTALQSIASKIAQHNLSNRTLGIYENMYNYRYAPGGQAYNMNAPYSWNIPTVGSGAKSTSDIALTEAERLQALADAQKLKEANAKSKKTARNGAIVKAIKGL